MSDVSLFLLLLIVYFLFSFSHPSSLSLSRVSGGIDGRSYPDVVGGVVMAPLPNIPLQRAFGSYILDGGESPLWGGFWLLHFGWWGVPTVGRLSAPTFRMVGCELGHLGHLECPGHFDIV